MVYAVVLVLAHVPQDGLAAHAQPVCDYFSSWDHQSKDIEIISPSYLSIALS